MNKARNISNLIGRAIYGLISLSLGIISLTMMGVALWDIWVSVHERTLLIAALLNAIGLIVIGMAVFDVSKFFWKKKCLAAALQSRPQNRERLY
ncbi:hypothetical protein [Modicisalibacter luteus]|uniref:hypothetical protein n=1 Tax=Modicisalibacter luteus TaxID=453962 RepID=UPI00363E20D0